MSAQVSKTTKKRTWIWLAVTFFLGLGLITFTVVSISLPGSTSYTGVSVNGISVQVGEEYTPEVERKYAEVNEDLDRFDKRLENNKWR